MWYPQPVVVPFVFESHSVTYEDLSARAMWQFIPFDQRAYNAVNEIDVLLNFLYMSQGFYNDLLHTNAERKFLLMRSLFELVLANEYLELTDPKLLGWFLCLTAEDRTLIIKEGGLLTFIQKHPALQVDRQYVYVKPKTRENCISPPTTMSSKKSRYPSFYGASQCHNCGTSCPFGSKKCRCCGIRIEIAEDKVCMSENEKQLELLPNSVKEELNVLTAQNGATFDCTQSTLNTQKTRCTQSCDYGGPAARPPSYSKGMCPHAQCLSQLWKEVENREDTKHFKDTTAQASFSLDMELDRQSQVQKNDYTQNYQDQSCIQAEEADYQNLDQEVMPEYYSFSNTSLDHSGWNDGTRSTETGYNDSAMATKGSTKLSDEASHATMATAANSTDCFSCLSNSFEVDNESGDPQEDMRKKHDSTYEQQIEEISLKSKSGASVFVDQIIDACGDFRACFTSTCATEVHQIFQMKNVATDTDLLAVNDEKDTQTVQKATSEKNTITEVCMSDLDVLTEEFIKLKETTNELQQLKSRKASPSAGGDHCRGVCGCDCAQRLSRAELRLLALQFVMCQQHCWRYCFTSPLGESALWGTEGLPDSIAERLNVLRKDYLEMRKQILAGTPLDDLKPLSVDTEKTTTMANYSPALVLEAHLDSLGCPENTTASGDRVVEERTALSTEVCRDTEAALDDAKGDKKQDKVLVFLHKQPEASAEKNPGVIKDPNSSEAWFDAEEELGSPNQDGKIEKLIERRERTDEDESNQSSLLCITSLPGNITEHEVLLWFEKYNATNVSISTFSNSMRAAIVYLKNPSDAKAAVKDLNGCSLQGHTVQVVQLGGPASADPKLISNRFHSTLETHKAETEGGGQGAKCLTYSSSHGGPRCSVDRLTNVCDSPTASGTCVPQHYATMGSFDTIMARLSERHPNVGRQRIVDALLELRAKHQGFLSGLPLRSIVDMTSELLTQASIPTYI